MIIYGGKIYDSKDQDRLLNELEPYINEVLVTKKLDIEKVIHAIDTLSRELSEGKYDDIFNKLQLSDPDYYKSLAISLLSEKNIRYKLTTELGNMPKEYITSPPDNLPSLKVKRVPLGVIFHIAAGNTDGLPAFSLVEGLLGGNINILKLPQADNDLSVKIIFRLIEIEPSLADFIFVFDTPSSDISAMRKMATFADGISVWGSNTAISAIRNLAPVGVKLIEWGHKLSFCYISDYKDKTDALEKLADHIAFTKQFLCSSCQTVFIDTESEAEIHNFCKLFLPILQKAVDRHKSKVLGEKAHFTLIRQTELLQEMINGKFNPDEYHGNGCRVIACKDSDLELSPMMCSVLVKRLPKKDIVTILRRKKGFLQTAGLICEESARNELIDIFSSCGVTKITTPGNMSYMFSGENHDGEYPLSRYTKIINIDSGDRCTTT